MNPDIRRNMSCIQPATSNGRLVRAIGLSMLSVIAAAALAGCGGATRHKASASNSGNANSQPSPAHVCAALWASEASQLDEQEAAYYQAQGSSNTAPAAIGESTSGTCVLTVASSTGPDSGFMQFEESSGQWTQGAAGINTQLPSDWTWNATVNSNGMVSLDGAGS